VSGLCQFRDKEDLSFTKRARRMRRRLKSEFRNLKLEAEATLTQRRQDTKKTFLLQREHGERGKG